MGWEVRGLNMGTITVNNNKYVDIIYFQIKVIVS